MKRCNYVCNEWGGGAVVIKPYLSPPFWKRVEEGGLEHVKQNKTGIKTFLQRQKLRFYFPVPYPHSL